MALHVALLNTMLDAAAERATTASLHTADPGSDGSSEVSGGSYARQTVTWSAASGGTLTNASGWNRRCGLVKPLVVQCVPRVYAHQA